MNEVFFCFLTFVYCIFSFFVKKKTTTLTASRACALLNLPPSFF